MGKKKPAKKDPGKKKKTIPVLAKIAKATKPKPGELWLVCIILGNLPGYSPDVMPMWNLLQVASTQAKAIKIGTELGAKYKKVTVVLPTKVDEIAEAIFAAPFANRDDLITITPEVVVAP